MSAADCQDCRAYLGECESSFDRIMELKKVVLKLQKTIAVMEYDLINKGVNFDYSKVEERHRELSNSPS